MVDGVCKAAGTELKCDEGYEVVNNGYYSSCIL